MGKNYYPDFNILNKPTLEEKIPPKKEWILDFIGPLVKNSDLPLPDELNFESDGKYLSVNLADSSPGDYAFYFFLIAAGLLLLDFFLYWQFGQDRLVALIIVTFLVILFCAMGLILQKHANQHISYNIIFNRENGLVYLPPVRLPFTPRASPYEYAVVHFSEMEGYYQIVGTGERWIETFLVANLPGESDSPRVYRLPFAPATYRMKSGEKEYWLFEQQWAFLCRFMDPSKPLPKIPAFSDTVDWYKKNNKTMPELRSMITNGNFVLSAVKKEYSYEEALAKLKKD